MLRIPGVGFVDAPEDTYPPYVADHPVGDVMVVVIGVGAGLSTNAPTPITQPHNRHPITTAQTTYLIAYSLSYL